MTFQTAYNTWFERHLKQRKGERKRRLAQGHGHAEKLFIEQVWYPAFRQFDGLHPEFEIADFRDGSRFLDFAFIRFPLRLAIEIDGYGPHSAKTSRWQFSDSLMRQNHLIIDGWRILRFSYDDVSEKPRMCEQILQQFMGSWIGAGIPSRSSSSDIIETEVLRLALRMDRFLRPGDICDLLQVQKDKARDILHSLLRKQYLLPAGRGVQRIRCYKVNREQVNERNWLL
jgi:very-short-patch-repair endonuclease